jgi:hypothetical protein
MLYASKKMKLQIPISTILKSNPFQVTFSENEYDSTEINEIDIERSIQSVNEEIDYKLKTGKCSRVLRRQLAIHRLNGYEKFRNKQNEYEYHHYHYATIRDTIEAVENGIKINIRPPFNGDILAGLEHFHHNSETFLKNNIVNYWKKKVGQNNEIEYQNNLLSNIYEKLKSEHGIETAKKKSVQVLLNQIHNESNFRRFDIKTGEWVVFIKFEREKYYLCLATHDEPDEDIYERILPCLKEFKELSDIKIGK